MNETEVLKSLQEENEKLKEENQNLLNIMVQMKETLNRLISRYIVEEKAGI